MLASGSPRRADLLRAAGYRFRIVPPGVDEAPRRGESAAAAAQRLAIEKALQVASRPRLPGGCLVLGADTIVATGRRILGKPADPADAARMLRALAGRAHRVVTGVAVCRAGGVGLRSGRCTTEVRFRSLSAADIRWYVGTGEPRDKAGGYGIQGAGGLFVESIRGSSSNVVGLPLEMVLRLLGRPA